MANTSDSIKDAVQAWCDTRWQGKKACVVCQQNNWIAGEEIVYVGGVSPMALIVCTHCGYTVFFNAVIVGLVG